ncbi:unnamed protein product [Urochloa decumbens]|uniref:Uncharacterized protein n=1 Tax=Urochloa decumbens TaxID=240449 RepID=A0ABC9GHX2_9POAL
MGKKRAAPAAPVFPFPAAASAGEPDHFSDYGFDPQLVDFFAQPEAKRPPSWSRRHHGHQPPPPPLESARFKLQKPISKKHRHLQKQQQRRRRWWSSAASAALLLFKRTSSSCSPAAAPAPAPPPYGSSASAAVPLYLADPGDAGPDDGGPAACACWAPAMRSGRLAAAELGAAANAVPYVSLRSASLGGGGGAGGAGGGAPAMPIYLVT